MALEEHKRADRGETACSNKRVWPCFRTSGWRTPSWQAEARKPCFHFLFSLLYTDLPNPEEKRNPYRQECCSPESPHGASPSIHPHPSPGIMPQKRLQTMPKHAALQEQTKHQNCLCMGAGKACSSVDVPSPARPISCTLCCESAISRIRFIRLLAVPHISPRRSR